MGQVAERIDRKLDQIKEIGGTPSLIKAGSETQRKLREELDNINEIAGNGGTTVFSPPDAYPLKYRAMIVTEAHGEATHLSVTYINVKGEQIEESC